MAQAAVLVVLMSGPAMALTVLAPTAGQAVREMVKITVPADAVSASSAPGFLSVLVEENGTERFVAAFSRESATESGNRLTFYWNSKAPYYDPNSPMKHQYFKDGIHTMTVQVHDSDGKTVDTATVDINLRNKISRPNPAPAVSLVNKLSFGQVNTYRVRSDVQVFEVVARVGLPILGGLGIQGDYRVVQSVEDVRPDGQLLMRYRIGENAFISSEGVKTPLYANEVLLPQLYRLVTKYGQVKQSNLFSKQARYSLMDVLPVLPARGIKEGDSWPDEMTVKVEGLTPLVSLSGTSQLDSFEWDSGRRCAKIVSQLSGEAPMVLLGGKIAGTGPMNANVTTFFAYETGRMLRRDIDLEFPATISPDLSEAAQAPASSMLSPLDAIANYYKSMPFDEDDDFPGESARPGNMPPTGMPGVGGTDSRTKKGTVRINVSVQLEK